MCGIAGYLGTRRLDPRRVGTCLERMRHRGPDTQACFETITPDGRHLALLHARLRVIDLDDRANQPLHHDRQTLIFNGALYNYRELRRTLARDDLQTESDTEVMLRILHERGWAGLDACEGMWALALYDGRSGVLTLARDRFGEKPLLLLRRPEGIYFGSEVKFLQTLAGPIDVDRDHIRRYLVNGYKALYKNGTGFFKDVEEIPPATVMEFHGEHQRAHRYWSPECEQDPSMTFDEAVLGVRAALIESVELRLRADVPVAFLLSGGVDSNALVGIARQVLGQEVHGFSIVNRDRRYDEWSLIEQAVAASGIHHTALPIETTSFLQQLRTLVHQHDAPVYTITYYAQWRLLQTIADAGYRVSISGTGADELLTGYYDHHNAYLFEMKNQPAYDTARSAWLEHIRPIVRNPHLQDPDLFLREPSFRSHIFLDADVFGSWMVTPWHEPFSERRYCDGLLRNRMLNELFHESVPPILHEDDLNSMSRSIENRSPFLDRRLFEFCQRIPTSHLIRDGFAKAILREAVRPFVPDAIVDERRKVGFNAPILDYLDRSSAEVRETVLEHGPIFELVRRDVIEDLLAAETLPNSRSKFLFYFLSAKFFLESCAT